MESFGSPQRPENQATGMGGEAFINYFVLNQLGWVYRPVPRENDFGIDGYIDIVSEGKVTGLSLAVQVKCGDSYLRKTPAGIKFVGERKHLNYYLNLSTPVILIVISSNHKETYWVEFDIEKTSPSGERWWIEIPNKNQLNETVKPLWSKIGGVPEDHSEKVQKFWAENERFAKMKLYLVAIPKNEVESGSFETLERVFDRLSSNSEMLVQKRNSVEIFFPDYDDDKRELFQIPEVRNWFEKSLEIGIPWFYFLSTKPPSVGLHLSFGCAGELDTAKLTDKGYIIFGNKKSMDQWFNLNYHNLNIFTEKKGLSEAINRRISKEVGKRMLKMLNSANTSRRKGR